MPDLSLDSLPPSAPPAADVVTQKVLIDKARSPVAYPIQYAVINIPLTLNSRTFGDVVWTPGINLSSRTIFSPTFTGSQNQLYTIEIKTKTGFSKN